MTAAEWLRRNGCGGMAAAEWLRRNGCGGMRALMVGDPPRHVVKRAIWHVCYPEKVRDLALKTRTL